LTSVSTQQFHEIKAKLEQCKAELNSTTEGEEGERAGSRSISGKAVLQTWAFWGQLQHNFLDCQATSP